MQGQPNSKIVGATIVGFALVGGAFTISSLQAPKQPIIQAAAVSSATALRVPIPVTDTSGDGIEDWREEFITTKPTIIDRDLSDYTLPQTLTGQTSIAFLEDVIRSRGYGPFGRSEEEVIQNTVNKLGKEANYKIYDTPDIIIMSKWDNDDIRNYANTVAATVYRHSIPNMDGELEILLDLVSNINKPQRYQELLSLVEVYRGYRDDTLKIPVPAFLVKEHLDLINTYHAIFEDITGMTMYDVDPAITLLRLKRYQDDATGLAYAFQNMSLALEPYADYFSVDDPALLFVLFHPDIQIF
jgi:hypothetical protein